MQGKSKERQYKEEKDLRTNPIDTEEKFMGIDAGLAEENDDKNPLEGMNDHQIKKIVDNAQEAALYMETIWNSTKNEFKITEEQIKGMYVFNENHLVPMPPNLSEEEQQKWDHFQSIDIMEFEDVCAIFGEEHGVLCSSIEQTRDRLHSIMNDFFNWLSALRYYEVINRAYLQLIEIKEEQQIIELKMVCEKETDPEKKAKMQSSLNDYYKNRTLGFLADPLPKNIIDYLVKAYGDKSKIEYWLNRTRDRFKQTGVNSKFILEISQFEKRFLPEKYHSISNTLLLYFCYKFIYKNDNDPNYPMFMLVALNNVIQKVFDKETTQTILNNVMALLDQFVEPINTAYPIESRPNN